MPMTPTADRLRHSGLITPLVCVAFGVAYLVAGLVAGDPGFALGGFALMTGFAVVLLLARRRSETVQGLLDRRDERLNQIDLTATAFAGSCLILAVLAGFVVEIARGQDGSPYSWLGAIAGVAYLGAVVVQRVRR